MQGVKTQDEYSMAPLRAYTLGWETTKWMKNYNTTCPCVHMYTHWKHEGDVEEVQLIETGFSFMGKVAFD